MRAEAMEVPAGKLWRVQSIDTMKYSRDLAGEKGTDPSFDSTIDLQVRSIAGTGATHVAVGTPYDDQFIPFLTRWVSAARKYQLSVWFRGNFAGWENWFDYPDLSRADHLVKTRAFILSHKDLFQDGDIFTSCPECENGGPGDPRTTGDVAGYRRFIIDLYSTCTQAFLDLKIQVTCNYFSSNGDVAKLIYDKPTVQGVGGVISIDHYVRTQKQLTSYISALSQHTGAKIVLGEYGAPIPDIHGNLSQADQAAWLEATLTALAQTPQVEGLNYWTSFGGSTELWENDGTPRSAVAALSAFYNPPQYQILVKNEAGQALTTAQATYLDRIYQADNTGLISLPVLPGARQAVISAPDYLSHGLQITAPGSTKFFALVKTHENWLFKLYKLTYRLFRGILP